MARQFGHTWWGRAWVDALEHRARLDPNRLPRGRTYARHERVQTLRLGDGEITAFVRGSRPQHYRVRVGVRPFWPDEWERLLDAIASRAAHTAALLDGELEPSIAADAERAGVDLLPGPGDLTPRCSCPDHADPCKHAAAVCYLAADALDEDPFALFALRGRGRDDLMDDLRARRRTVPEADTAPAVPAGPAPDEGVVARQAWADWPGPGDGLGPPPVPARPGRAAAWPTDPPAGATFTAEGLRTLVTDAAHRAWAQLRGEGDSGLALDAAVDLARRAALVLDDVPAFAGLARRSGESTAELGRRAEAWRVGGAPALVALDLDRWRPPVATMAAARAAVEEAGAVAVSVRDHWVAVGPTVQVRLDRAGAWWRFEKRRGRWELVAGPAPAPDDLV